MLNLPAWYLIILHVTDPVNYFSSLMEAAPHCLYNGCPFPPLQQYLVALSVPAYLGRSDAPLLIVEDDMLFAPDFNARLGKVWEGSVCGGIGGESRYGSLSQEP